SLAAVNQNPICLQRVDENWRPDCTRDAGNQFGNVVPNYTLYYSEHDGERQELASYPVDNLRDALNSDLRWVSPGAPGSIVPADSGSFEVELSPIPPDENGARTIQMEVSAISGSAKNVWDLWAGPPAGYYASIGLAPLSPDVNERNLQLANNPTFYDTRGISVLALGRMPVAAYHGDIELKLPLAPVEVGLGGGTAYATLFDYDAATRPPLHFTFDTVADSTFDLYAAIVPNPKVGHSGTAADPLQMACEGTIECDNAWLTPQVPLLIPREFFLGGTLEANYTPGRDDHVWSLAITSGRPFLTR
ncbi:MAG: hypothetical protein R3300_18140, partial [Candidatus Promineifilaceae bacterium]|nr:hypothetical protein [Candidatus Promineifilaceae bacterium]